MRIRPAASADAAGILELSRALVRDGRGQVMLEADLPADAAAAALELQPDLEAEPDAILRLVAAATDSGAVVGEARIARYGPGMLRHAARLSLGVHPAWQGRGVGRSLMAAMLQWADAPERGPAITWVELCVRGDNERAIGLYRSVGFAVEGVRRGFVQPPGGGPPIDDLIMVRRRGG